MSNNNNDGMNRPSWFTSSGRVPYDVDDEGPGEDVLPTSDTMDGVLNRTNTTDDIYDATDVINQLENNDPDDKHLVNANDSMLSPDELDRDNPGMIALPAAATIVAAAANANGNGQQWDNDDLEGNVDPKSSSSSSNITSTSSIGRQLWVLMYNKNMPLITRQPLYLCILLFSTIASVLLSWPTGHDPTQKDNEAPITYITNRTSCNTIPYTEFINNNTSTGNSNNIQLSYNENWRDGVPVAMISIGPLLFSIVVFLIIHEDIVLHMYSSIRQLGISNTIYWLSWFLPFLTVALINSFLGTCTCKLLRNKIHVYDATYFMGILGSFFFLHVALICSSMFLVTIQGMRKRGVVMWIVIMIIAIWMPLFTMNIQSPYFGSYDVESISVGGIYSSIDTPTKLFWIYRQTETPNSFLNNNDDQFDNTTTRSDTCHIPIISEEQSLLYQTQDERDSDINNDFFTGCYVSAGWGAASGLPHNSEITKIIGSIVWWFFPYYHFTTIWGNFCGYTSIYPNIQFTSKQMTLTTAELANDLLPSPSQQLTSSYGSLYPQGSMLQHESSYESICSYTFCESVSNCPSSNAQSSNGSSYNLCSRTDTLVDCPRALEPSPVNGSSVYFMIFMLTLLSITYMTFTMYWSMVFVGGAGTYSFYFFLLPSFWCPTSTSSRKKGTTAVATDINSDDSKNVVQVMGVAKSYGKVMALQPVSFQMRKGEVTALLGHNGAGKTTLSKVLTCEVAPTNGDVIVFDYSIQSNSSMIRQMVGVCKQDNYLWPNLSAKEHLDIFAGLCGVPRTDHDAIVQQWLESVDLESAQHQYSSQYSGGMKRRLSLAMSTIGSRSLIVLDEPTTGMDPVSRRYVWKHIDEIKKDRVVLLTTHAMEEADMLADSVAIMRKGELAAWGTPLELKSEYGSALQFSILVDKALVSRTEAKIQSHFASHLSFIKVDAGEAGNISVLIEKIQQSGNDSGLDVETLTSFIAWLEDTEQSGVTEYGFSNSSLEEVFLKITEGDIDAVQTNTGELGTFSSDVEVNTPENRTTLASYKPMLTIRGQVFALIWQNMIRTWTGSRSIGNWLIYGFFVAVNVIIFVWLGSTGSNPAYLAIAVILASFILLSFCSAIYGDRAEELFYLMRTQGLLKNSYLLGTMIYAFMVAFVYVTIILGSLYATPFFRDPSICVSDPSNDFCSTKFGDSPLIEKSSIQDVTYLSNIEGSAVQLFAFAVPGGYQYIFGAGFVFSLSVPCAALASAYLPGHKFALLCIAMLILMAGITPLITYFLPIFVGDDKELLECTSRIVSITSCFENLGNRTLDTDFLNCVGIYINSQQLFCTPAYTALLPQYALFQMLGMTLVLNIKFFTEPPEYNEEVFIPSIAGDHCSGDRCSFPYATKLYLENMGWSVLGSFILVVVGVIIAHIFGFPTPLVLYIKGLFSNLWESASCRGKKSHESESPEKHEMEEVQLEREAVEMIIKPLLNPLQEGTTIGDDAPTIVDHSNIVHEDLPPILMHKLRKVYPSFGRLPPKIALKSLDLHVDKGQVLGFLGKNGAGKTTALKILAAAHDASSGIGLVSGFDVSCERIKVFENLGNCPQFDVIWPKLTVKEHLTFFAKLKGIPRKEVPLACSNIAAAVGLGALTVYNRNAGALSGGMRRRLSIAISLIGAPSVFVLDEPTTGLDPSTRNNIWSLVESFATEDRAIIITTHMMLEADTLCNRIAIISKGELVVVATQQRLKDKFGSGYLLQLNLVKSTLENQEMAMEFVRKELHEGATMQAKQAKTLHINIPRDLDVKRAFAALYTPTIRPDCINQFLLSQSSLEDVFIALGE